MTDKIIFSHVVDKLEANQQYQFRIGSVNDEANAIFSVPTNCTILGKRKFVKADM